MHKPCLLLVGADIAGPPAVRGNIFWASRHGKGGRSQAPPLRQNCEITLKIISTLSRFMVGVGLCSTRGAVGQHRALTGEQCSPLRWNSEIAMEILRKPESIACRGLHCRPANGAGVYFGVSGCGKGGRAMLAPTVKLRNNAKIQTHSLAAYCRGGALLHLGGLVIPQGFGGRAMLAPTMKF